MSARALLLLVLVALASCSNSGPNLYRANRAVDKAEAQYHRGEISFPQFRAVCLERERVLAGWTAEHKAGYSPMNTDLMLNRIIIDGTVARLPSQRQIITTPRP